MLYTPHAITGATIAYFIPNPFIAIILSLVSHLFFDVFPHSNPNPIKSKGVGNLIILGEIVIGTVVLAAYSYLLSGKFVNSNYAMTIMIICGITANLPDILTGPYAMFRKNWFYSESIAKFQGLIQNHVKGYIGYTLQVVFISVLVYIAFLH
ncbi:hypothetical protein GW755_03980 [bacterium]|nr:hypothetical protein [bacterium]